MKFKMLLSIIILLTLVITGQAFAEPKMNFSNEMFDFGYAPQKSQISYRFWIYSVGIDTLQIVDVRPGCGCTKAPLEKKIIPPGDSAFVDITFNTGQSKGKTTKTVGVIANTPEKERRVSFTADIITDADSTPPLLIKPSALDFASLKDKKELSFSLENRTGADLNLQLLSTPRENFEIKLPKSIKAGGNAKAKVKLLAKTLPQELVKSFTFFLNDDLQTKFTIPVKAEAQLSGIPPAKH
jgi:hypothetical protein